MALLPSLKKQPAPHDAEKLNWLRLARTENVGPVTFYRLLERYGTAARALEAIPVLAARGGRKKPLAIPASGLVEREYENLRKIGGNILIAGEEAYPLPLTSIEDAPPVLSVLGNPALLRKSCIGLVGARNASLNGKKFAEKLAQDLGAASHVVVSGLARGIDTAAHGGALATGTIAVVAGGIDIVYPPENRALYDGIIESGCIVAESPLGVAPVAQSFPRRNRIISGLSAGIVVVEATLKSGSLITARLAGEQGRDVYAVPGHPMDPRAEGPNTLIRDGATLVRGAADIIEHMGSFTGGHAFQLQDSGVSRFEGQPVAGEDMQLLDQAREDVLNALSFTAVAMDELVRDSGLPTALVLTAVLELELAGRARRLPGNRVLLVE